MHCEKWYSTVIFLLWPNVSTVLSLCGLDSRQHSLLFHYCGRLTHRYWLTHRCLISLSYVDVPLEFLISDVKIEDKEGKLVARHLILTSPEQINFLRNAATWYLNRTFKAVRDTFVQLFGIHSFLHCSDNVKQVPLVNVLMSRRTQQDYTAVFRELFKSMGDELSLEECVLDYELTAWNSLREIFPDIHIHAASSTTSSPSSAKCRLWVWLIATRGTVLCDKRWRCYSRCRYSLKGLC